MTGELLERIQQAEPARPTALTVRADPHDPVGVQFGRRKTLYASAYSGEALGEGSGKWRSFFSALRGWHRWLN